MIFRPNRNQLKNIRLEFERLCKIETNRKALEEIEDSLIELHLGIPGLVSMEDNQLFGSLSYELNNGLLSLNHLGSLQRGTGRALIEKLESMRPNKIILSSRQEAFGFYTKLGFSKGERYGDFQKEIGCLFLEMF